MSRAFSNAFRKAIHKPPTNCCRSCMKICGDWPLTRCPLNQPGTRCKPRRWFTKLGSEDALKAELRRIAEAERDKAEIERDRSQSFLYIAHMSLAQRAWDETNVGRVVELLDLQRPQPGQPDLRNFEWFYLDRISHSELLSLKELTNPVRSVAFRPDGNRKSCCARLPKQHATPNESQQPATPH